MSSHASLLIWATTGIGVLRDRGRQLHRKQCAKTLVSKAKEEKALLLIRGARGWDWEVMTYAYEMETQFKLYLPFKERLELIPSNFREKSLEIWYPFAEYNVKGYQVSYERMVNEASVLHAYWSDRKYWGEKKQASDIWNCISYALKKGIGVVNWYNVNFDAVDHAL